jgi:DNA-binding transcriptional MerR regulator
MAGMRHALLAALIASTGCAALRDRAVDYAQEVAVAQVELAIDRQLDKRGLSLAQLKQLADADQNGTLSAGEAARFAKDGLRDFVDLKVQLEADKASASLDEKLKALAGAKDLDELRAAAKEQDLFGKGTAGALMALLASYLMKQVFSAKSDGKRDARLEVLEKVTGQDLNRDGSVGAPPAAPAVA